MHNRINQDPINKAIGLPYFKKLKIVVPPYPEQKKIVQILSIWDKAITTTEQLLANSQQQKKALMRQLLKGKRRVNVAGSAGGPPAIHP